MVKGLFQKLEHVISGESSTGKSNPVLRFLPAVEMTKTLFGQPRLKIGTNVHNRFNGLPKLI
jgi:hypothetical protein